MYFRHQQNVFTPGTILPATTAAGMRQYDMLEPVIKKAAGYRFHQLILSSNLL
jgi:hypothetical protein